MEPRKILSSMYVFVSRRRFAVLGVSIATLLGALHFWTDTRPVIGVDESGFIATSARAVQIAEGRATDLQFRFRGPRTPHPDVLVVAVDERSVQKHGLWPMGWRPLVARAVRNLEAAGAGAVGLDIIFTDEVRDTNAIAYAEAIEQLDAALAAAKPETGVQLAALRTEFARKRDRSPDEELAAAFASTPGLVQGVIAYAAHERGEFGERGREHVDLLTGHVLTRFPGAVPGSEMPVDFDSVPGWPMHSAQTPLAALSRSGRHFGFFNAVPDPDGTLRRFPLFAKLEAPRGFLPNLALSTAAVQLGASIEPLWDPAQEKLVGARLRLKDAPPRIVPLSTHEPFSLINHVGSHKVFPTLSLGDVVDGTFDPEAVRGKAILIGVALVGNFDQRVTPFHEIEPGVFSHASFLSNILSDDYLRRPSGLRLLELAFIFAASLILSLLLPRVRFALKFGVTVALAAGWLAFDQLLFTQGLQLATVLPTLNVGISAFAVIFLSYLSVDREKAQLRSAFQHYLNASVMEEMLKHPEKLKLGGEKKEMTVLFSDIRGFTTLSERMQPEALVKFINSYLTPMTEIVFEEGGTLDKYIGDALMAFWGAPIDQEDHALRSCRAALRFIDELQVLKASWREQNLPEFDIGVGINSGPMIVGNMGSDIRFDYTVMGDAVNLASRLEGTNKEYETRVLMSEATYLLVQGQVVARRLGAVRVKGKRKPVRIYELRAMGTAEGVDAEAIATFESALDDYAQKRFEEARLRFERVMTLWPDDPPSAKYLAEIGVYQQHPPGPNWDGVYTATTK